MGLKREEMQWIERLYRELYRDLYYYACYKLRNSLWAEEAVQETFQLVCVKIEVVMQSKKPRGWIVNALKFIIANMNRRQQVWEAQLSQTAQEWDWVVNQHGYDPIEVYMMDVVYEELLGKEDYQLLKKVVIEKETQREVADELGISLAACQKRVQRAKERLRKILMEQ